MEWGDRTLYCECTEKESGFLYKSSWESIKKKKTFLIQVQEDAACQPNNL